MATHDCTASIVMASEIAMDASDYASLNGYDRSNGLSSDDTSRSSRTENDTQLTSVIKLCNGSGSVSCNEGTLFEKVDNQASDISIQVDKTTRESVLIAGDCSQPNAMDAISSTPSAVIKSPPSMLISATTIDQNGSATTAIVNGSDKNGPTPAASNALKKPVAADTNQIRPMASVLFSIGQRMVQRTACRAKRQLLQKVKKTGQKKDGKLEETRQKLDNEFNTLSSKLSRFDTDEIRCKGCWFSSPHTNVIELHKEYGHGHDDIHFRCAFCHQFSTYRESEYVFHIEAEHNRVARVWPRKAPFECPLCSFETRNSSSYSKHVGACAKYYNPKRNQEPTVADNDIPIKKQKNDLESIVSAGHKNTPIMPVRNATAVRSNNGGMKVAAVSNNFNRSNMLGTVRSIGPSVIGPSMPALLSGSQKAPQPIGISPLPQIPMSVASSSSTRIVQIGNNWYSLVPSGDRAQFTAVPIQPPVGSSLLIPPGRPAVSAGINSRSSLKSTTANARSSSNSKSSASIPLPVKQHSTMPPPADSMESIINAAVAAAIAGNAHAKQQSTATTASAVAASTSRSTNHHKGGDLSLGSGSSLNDKKHSAYEQCEMCDALIKNRSDLRIHFEVVHKIFTEAKLFNEPTPVLSCLKCTKRFWTYQGLSRHSKVDHDSSHGSKAPPPTSSKAPVGSQSSLPSLSSHQSEQQQQQAPAFPTYTCSLCQEKRIRYVLSHLKSKHGINVSEILAMKQCPCCGVGCSSAESVLVHMEAQHPEIISDPALKMYQLSCHFCAAKFTTGRALEEHCNAQHAVLCAYCDERFPNSAVLRAHVSSSHADERKSCPLCSAQVNISAAFVDHMTSMHLRGCSVRIARLLLRDIKSSSRPAIDEGSAKSGLSSPRTPASVERPSNNGSGDADNNGGVIVVDLD